MAAFDGERGEFRFAFGVSDDGAIERARGAATATATAAATATPAEEIDARDVGRFFRVLRAARKFLIAERRSGT